MAGQRQPIELVIAKGNKHLTKAEIEARRNGEIGPLDGNIAPPDYLTKKQKAQFKRTGRGNRSFIFSNKIFNEKIKGVAFLATPFFYFFNILLTCLCTIL